MIKLWQAVTFPWNSDLRQSEMATNDIKMGLLLKTWNNRIWNSDKGHAYSHPYPPPLPPLRGTLTWLHLPRPDDRQVAQLHFYPLVPQDSQHVLCATAMNHLTKTTSWPLDHKISFTSQQQSVQYNIAIKLFTSKTRSAYWTFTNILHFVIPSWFCVPSKLIPRPPPAWNLDMSATYW